MLATFSACRQPLRCSSSKSCEFTSMLQSTQRHRGGGGAAASSASAASRARFFAPRFGFGSPGFLPEKCTVSPACTLNMPAVVSGAVTLAASALPAAAASELPSAGAAVAALRAALASLRAALASLRAALAALSAASSSSLHESKPASSCSSARIRASSALPMDASQPARTALTVENVPTYTRCLSAVNY